MCGAFGYRVDSLKRVRVMNIKLEGLKPGQWRELSEAEEAELRKLVSKKRKRN
jgi:23S rRNA pseudouridine2604 synthase